MKKKYSLDYSIIRDTDRLAAINEILNQLDTRPSNADLEQMASYILYGKDENDQNAVQRGETTDGNKRYGTYRRKEDKNLSLEAVSELTPPPNIGEPFRRIYTCPKPTIRRPKKDDPGDSDIPGMTQLWESIDRLDHLLAVNEGKIAADEDTELFPNSYHTYQLRHQLADLRKHQYYLKDAYKPTIHFLAVDHPRPQFVDWTSDTYYWMSIEEWRDRVNNSYSRAVSKNIEDYETRENPFTNTTEVKWVVQRQIFDWENADHVRALIGNYELLYETMRERLDTYGRTLIFDFERYREMANFSPIRNFLLDEKIARIPYPQIIADLQDKFDMTYNITHISTIINKEIPNAIAAAAKRHRLIVTTPIAQKKKCNTCGRLLPRDKLFFGVNNSHKDHFSSTCKECEKKKRILKGGQHIHDKRAKDTTMPKMQSV